MNGAHWTPRLWLAIGAMIAAFSASAALASNPYRAIVARNAFRLRTELPRLPEPPVVPPPPAIKVEVTGVADVIGRKVALVEIASPGQPLLRPIMAEGETVGAVQLLHIDIAQARIRMRIQGVETNLALTTPKPGNVAAKLVPPAPPLVRR